MILLAVIVIPILLDDSRRLDTGISTTNIPEKPDDGFTTRLIPILEQDEIPPAEADGEDVPAPLEADAAVALEAATPAETATKDEAAIPDEAATPEEQAQPEPGANAGTENKGLTGYVVQVGSFSRANADKLNDKLRTAGYASYVVDEPVKTREGSELFRVRIGPEVLRSEALTLKAELKKEMDLDAIVMSYP